MTEPIKNLPKKHFETLMKKGRVDLSDIFNRNITATLHRGKKQCDIILRDEGMEIITETIDIPFDYCENEKLIFNFIKLKTTKRSISPYPIRSSIFNCAKRFSKIIEIPISVTEHIIRNPYKDISLEYWTFKDIRVYFKPGYSVIYFRKYEKRILIAETQTCCYTCLDFNGDDEVEIKISSLKTHSRLVNSVDYLMNYC